MKGICHCRAVEWQLDGDAGSITACNCTVCRRYGALWAYDWEGVLASVEPERLGRLELQRDDCSAICRPARARCRSPFQARTEVIAS